MLNPIPKDYDSQYEGRPLTYYYEGTINTMQKELRTLMEQVDLLMDRLTKLEEQQSTENEKAILRRLTAIEKKLQQKTTK